VHSINRMLDFVAAHPEALAAHVRQGHTPNLGAA